MKKILLFVLFLLPASASAQYAIYAKRIYPLPTAPAACLPGNGDMVYVTTGNIGLYECTASGTWVAVGLTRNGANTQLILPAGTAAVPSLTFTGGLTTGLYQAAATTIGFTSAGASIGTFNTSASFRLADAGDFGWATRSYIVSATDGVITMLNNAGNNFTGLTLGPAAVTHTRITVSAAVGGQAQGIILLRGDGTAQTQANLGAATNGSMIYCSDCTIANPCAGGGTGAIAKRLNGAWVCN